MNAIEIRPKFELDLPWSPEESSRRLQAVFRQPPFCDRGKSLGSVAEICVPDGQERLWSPHLSIVIDRHATDHAPVDHTATDQADSSHRSGFGCRLIGRFAPRPAVWTAVMMIYFSGSFLVFCGAVWGYAQWMMKTTPWALVSIPIGLACFMGIYMVSKIGQSLSADQMKELKELLDDAFVEMQRNG